MGLFGLGRGASPVGLDIGSSTFRLAQLKPSADKPTLISYASAQVSEDLIHEGEIMDIPGVSKALAQLWREKKITEKHVVVGVANQKVIVRVIEMPYMSEAELRSAIKYQISDHIPIPIEEAIIDFQVISERENDEQEKTMDVLVVAARKDMVENTISAIEGAGLKPIIVDVASLAFARAVMNDGKEPPVIDEPDAGGATAMINISSSLTDIVVIEDDIPRFTRISSVGGNVFTEALVDQLGVPYEDAEELKIGIGLPSNGDGSGIEEPEAVEINIAPDMSEYTKMVQNILEQEMIKFVGEIRRSLDYYIVQATGAKRINKVIVSGGGAKLKNFLNHLRDNLQLEVELGQPLRNVQIGKRLRNAGVESEELSMAICLGLAMRGIDQ